MLIDFENSPSRKKHWCMIAVPSACSLGVLSTGFSPCTSAMSAAVSSAQASNVAGIGLDGAELQAQKTRSRSGTAKPKREVICSSSQKTGQLPTRHPSSVTHHPSPHL